MSKINQNFDFIYDVNELMVAKERLQQFYDVKIDDISVLGVKFSRDYWGLTKKWAFVKISLINRKCDYIDYPIADFCECEDRNVVMIHFNERAKLKKED